MDAFLRDLRCGLRMLSKRKGFTLVVVLTLALATGTTTTLFSIVSKVLVTPLAFEAPETIAFVWSRNEGLSRVRAPLTFTEKASRINRSFSKVGPSLLSTTWRGPRRPPSARSFSGRSASHSYRDGFSRTRRRGRRRSSAAAPTNATGRAKTPSAPVSASATTGIPGGPS